MIFFRVICTWHLWGMHAFFMGHALISHACKPTCMHLHTYHNMQHIVWIKNEIECRWQVLGFAVLPDIIKLFPHLKKKKKKKRKRKKQHW